MASTYYGDLSSEWQASARYTAAGDTDINLSNPTGYSVLRWAITATDTEPTITVGQANPIKPEADKAMTLATGDRLWMATLGPSGAATVEV